MPDLLHSLQGHDLGYLRIVAELWGFELQAKDRIGGMREIAAAAGDARSMAELIETLRPSAREALSALKQAGGRIPWAVFSRQFGDIRDVGAARRDREKPYLKSESVAEDLFYRALLGRAFFETAEGVQEFAYIPDDCLAMIRDHLPHPEPQAAEPLGRRAERAEIISAVPATDRILEDATTLLAALRIDHPAPEDPVLRSLLESAGILKQGIPQSAAVRGFLEQPRSEALRMLVNAWISSDTFNELRLMPGLICEGAWANQPRATRHFLLSQLELVPPRTWWSVQAFVAGIKQHHADFQRPAGDYDSWFIRSAADGSYLRGFSSWDQVDGALVRFLITNVMHRLGILELAGPGEGKPPTSFRRPEVLSQPARPSSPEDGRLHITSQGRITAPNRVARAVRYQLARFCEWDDPGAVDYRYHISPRALERASKQGLKVAQLVNLLARHGDAGIPSPVTKALRRWEAAGTEARTEAQVVLRVKRPEILKELRKSKAAKYLGEPLGPTTVIVKGGAMRKVAEAMIELGVLLEDKTDSSN